MLTDARGYALAQNTGSIPSFIGTLPATVRHFLRAVRDAGRPGWVEAFGAALCARAGGAMRAAIREVPGGTYRSGMRTEGVAEPLDYKVALTVAGDEITADFTGTSPQQPRAINCVL